MRWKLLSNILSIAREYIDFINFLPAKNPQYHGLITLCGLLTGCLGNLPDELTRTVIPSGEIYGIRGIAQLESHSLNRNR